MVVEKGQAWGRPGRLPDGAVLVRSDAEARAVVTEARRHDRPVPPLGLLGGDLCRTVGGRGDEARLCSGEATVLPVDLGSVLIDGRLHWFVAHLVARRSWWRGRVLAAMNAEYIGHWDVSPRGHPGDGQLDLLDGNLSFTDRLKARRRLPLGTHVPHPGIEQRRVASGQVAFDGATPIWLDGERVAEATNLSLRIEPEALVCVV